jgi:hypothetical protein
MYLFLHKIVMNMIVPCRGMCQHRSSQAGGDERSSRIPGTTTADELRAVEYTDKLRQRPPRACVPRPRLSSTYTTIGIVACVSRCGGRCMGASSIDRCMGASSIDRRYRLSSSIAPRRHRAAVLSLPSPVSKGPLVVCLADA